MQAVVIADCAPDPASPPYPIRMKLRDLADRLGCELRGDGAVEINGVAGMEQATARQLTFLSNPKYTHR